jgi:hypothetical protein
MKEIADMYAPIVLFCYKRLDTLIQTVEALQKNYLAAESDLFIFSDAAKNELDLPQINDVREYLRRITGFRSVEIYCSVENKGLATSIIDGVSLILNDYEYAIVLEDDLVTTPNFLDFMNRALSFYKSDVKVFSISGYTLDLPSLKTLNDDFYFGVRASSWGWGIWKDRWGSINWELDDYETFIKNKEFVRAFQKGGSDMPRMLRKQHRGKIDSWAIRFCFHQFKHNLVTVFPKISKLESVGFSKNATHTKSNKRFKTPLDQGKKIDFEFEYFIRGNPKLLREFQDVFSLKNRILNQIRQRLM